MGDKNSNLHNQKAKILIADDNQEFLDILTRRVEKMGHHVETAVDGIEAIEKIKNNAYDLLIVDYGMPGKTGLAVIESSKELNPNMQIIMVTGTDSIEVAVEALRFRVFDFLQKPLSSLTDFEKKVTQALAAAQQQQEIDEEIKETLKLATTEPLTGLWNRHKLDEMLIHHIHLSEQNKQPLTIIMLDLDGLKGFNDRHGHLVGDDVLKVVSEIIQIAIRKDDIPFRYGGDEFLIILPDADDEQAVGIAERILYLAKYRSVKGEDLSISVGVAQLDAKIKDNKDLIRLADEAMYRSKENQEKKITLAK